MAPRTGNQRHVAEVQDPTVLDLDPCKLAKVTLLDRRVLEERFSNWLNSIEVALNASLMARKKISSLHCQLNPKVGLGLIMESIQECLVLYSKY